MIIKDNKLIPSPGMVLYDGETLSTEVYLGINDSKENWYEIPEAMAEMIEAKMLEESEPVIIEE